MGIENMGLIRREGLVWKAYTIEQGHEDSCEDPDCMGQFHLELLEKAFTLRGLRKKIIQNLEKKAIEHLRSLKDDRDRAASEALGG